jgi:hypothetical protein
MRPLLLVGLAVLAGAVLPAAGTARTTATAISISAQTSNNPVGDLVWATYGKTAAISGATADGLAGTAVELQAQSFPFQADFTPLGQTQTTSGGSYSFAAKPTLATRYRVVLVSDPTSSQSSVVTVYVGARWSVHRVRSCPIAASCHLVFGADIVYPPAVAKREGAKRVYDYFGVRYGSQSTPPKRVKLVQKGQQHRHKHRYGVAFSVTFPTPDAFYYNWDMCTKDTETRDGFGLPGHHHCGARFLSHGALQGYVG